MPSMRVYLLELNLFQPDDGTVENEHDHRSNIIATRVYLGLLVLMLIGFSLGLSMLSETKIYTLHRPSESQVKNIVVDDLNCPCSRISLIYEQFVTIEASFHQVCSSDFVTNRWIQTIFSGSNTTIFFQGDFRAIGSALFQGLAALCKQSKENTQDSIAAFLATAFINPQLLSQNAFDSKVQATIAQFEQTVHMSFQSQLRLINRMIFGNQIMSALRTAVLPLYTYGGTEEIQAVLSYELSYQPTDETQCSCYDGFDCAGPSGFYDAYGKYAYFNVIEQHLPAFMFIPGLVSGCMPMNSLLLSTLECFYNQTCVNGILSFLSAHHHFTAMPVIEQSIFQPNSTVQSIVDQTMVEYWSKTISYEKYFTQCAPIACTYSKLERHGFVFVLTKMIGLLGGLILVLGLIVSAIVRSIRNRQLKKNQLAPSPRIALATRSKQLIEHLKCYLIEMNLFKNQSLEDRQIDYQRIGTRLYLLILIATITTITLNSSLTREIRRETVLNPTESQYTHLQQIHASLVCFCRTISISHESFISIKPIYHQVCSSGYVSPAWIKFLNQAQDDVSTSLFPYQINLGAQFTMLSIFCESIEQTIDDALRTFLQAQFVSSIVLAQDIFDSQSRSLVNNWQLNTINRYQHVIELLRAIYQGNLLMSDRFNYKIQVNFWSNQPYPVPFRYPDCSCALSKSCSAPLSLFICYGAGTEACVEQFRIPNFFTGCFPMEALFQSTLECFYNRTCVDRVEDYFAFYGGGTVPNISTLAITSQWPNDTREIVESIIERLMVNAWEKNISFTSYFQTCAPTSCTFESFGRPHILFVITTVIGIFGGLSTGFKILMLIILRSIEKIREGYFRRSVIHFMKSIFACSNEQQMTPRVHAILVIVTLSILYLITFLIPHSTTVTITQPSLSVYQDLLEQFPDSLQCPCSKISFKYQSFLTMEPRFHQICSSEFMSNDWTSYIYNKNQFSSFDHTDFQDTALSQFQLLATLCQLSEKTVNNTLSQLLASNYIDAQLTSFNSFEKRIQGTIDQFQLRTPKTFLNTFNLIREILAANMLMSVHLTNWNFQNFNSLTIQYQDGFLETLPLDYEQCNCGVSFQCTQPSRGMMAGCYPLEALLQATLQCFYDQECIDSNGAFRALNSTSSSSRFDVNTTIGSIFQTLMIEEYLNTTSYENYFAQCAPSLCTYSYSTHQKTIAIITSLIELYSGLVIICGWTTVLIIKLYQCRVQRVVPQT